MIPLTMPNLSGNEKKYLNNCIDTTFVSSVGEYVNRLERMIAEATGSKYAVATSAGTTGLHAALTAVGVACGDLVILPTFTFIASANAIRHCGAVPWLMDISSNDWCLDPASVRLLIETECESWNGTVIHKLTGRKVSAIMPVYTLGNIPDMKQFRTLADAYNLPLVADAACAIGAEYDHQPFAPFADLSVLSFNGNKTVTCGGGGAVVGNDERLLGLVRHITTTARVWPDYDFDMVGFNYRMTNIQAAVGCAQMEKLDQFINAKRRVRRSYEALLGGLSHIKFFPGTDGSSCWLSGIILENGSLSGVKQICAELKEQNIEARPFWKPVHLQEPYKYSPKGPCQIAEGLWDKIVTLPCSTNITENEIKLVCDKLSLLLMKTFP